MTREIKFRAWDKENKKMIDSSKDDKRDYDEYWGDALGLKLVLIEEMSKDTRFEVMQYTGLKDKNGKEIYEKDIVNEFRKSRSFPEGRNIKRVVEWQEMTLDDSYGEMAVGFNLFGGELEIIGNIYENPELIKK